MPDDRLAAALTKLDSMQHPSIAKLLRGAGYEYEADAVEEVLAAAHAAKLVRPTLKVAATLRVVKTTPVDSRTSIMGKTGLVKKAAADAEDKKMSLGLTEADLIVGES